MNTLVLEQTENGDVAMDVYQKLAQDRILFLSEDLHDELATDMVATLLLKDSEDPDKKITLFINSHGGDIRNAFMIYDVMTMIQAPIETVCIGAAMDEALILLAGGARNAFCYQARHYRSHPIIARITYAYRFAGCRRFDAQHKLDNDRLMDILAKTTGKSD